ncbi:MAG: hypothetical protein V7K40_05000 [Nostoc sp.]|uniref:hypothetical protein n=1 Tax=Nostoc sp. TaxID=1180 RepID=UPI002FFB988B
MAVIFDDQAHSIDEQRKIIIGHSQQNLLLFNTFAKIRGYKNFGKIWQNPHI